MDMCWGKKKEEKGRDARHKVRMTLYRRRAVLTVTLLDGYSLRKALDYSLLINRNAAFDM